MNKYENIGKIIGGILGETFSLFFFTWLVMLLWNKIMVETFDLPTISFWTAFGMRWLCHWLFSTNINIKFFTKK